MFKDIDQALSVLIERKNMTLGIDYLNDCLTFLGNPQNRLNCIHIGGTNGKGSTTNYVRSILQESGYKVGTFTSPHLVSHNDRIRINNIPISDEKLLYYLNETYPFWDRFKLSMFEIDMLISILYFLEEEVEWVVYEVGLGGRLDATNVITPKVIGITNVDFDHMGILGDTLDKIAYEKAGIFKKDVPIYTTETKLECLEVFSDRSQKLNAVLNQVKIPKYKGNYNFNVLGIEIELVDQGIYQIDNATLAIYLIKALELEIKDSVIKKAIENTNWPGRFERVRDNLFLDGAHNEVGVLKMLKTLSDYPRPWRVVFTALGDKDHRKMVKTLYDAVDELIITEFDFYRAASARDIAKNLNVRVIKDYKQAIDYLLKNSKGTSVVTGSLYFISDARAYLKSVE